MNEAEYRKAVVILLIAIVNMLAGLAGMIITIYQETPILADRLHDMIESIKDEAIEEVEGLK